MPIVHLMVGLPCAGKSTWAREIEAETGAVCLTPDAWQTRLFGNDWRHLEHQNIHDRIEAIMIDLAVDLLARGVDVILDFGFWTKAERQKMRAWAQELGATCVLHYAAAEPSVLERRMVERAAAARPDDFVFVEGDLAEWLKVFEPPDAGELKGGEIRRAET